MSKIYTLSSENTDNLAHLNRKLLKVQFIGDVMVVIDATNWKVLRISTRVVSKEEVGRRLTVTTESGTFYDLVDATTVVPSYCESIATGVELEPVIGDLPDEIDINNFNVKVEDDLPDINDILKPILGEDPKEEPKKTLDPIEEIHISHNIWGDPNLGDGYSGTVYKFDREVQELDFEAFLILKGENLSNMGWYGRYERHPKIIKGELHDDQDYHEFPTFANPGDISDTWTYIMIKPKITEEEKAEVGESFGLIDTTPIFRNICYGDGYSGAVYTFDEEKTFDEFKDYLTSVGEDLSKLTGYAWYENHPKIIKGALRNGDKHEPEHDADKNYHGRVWTYIVVAPYTD